jgi:hypothetical protein
MTTVDDRLREAATRLQPPQDAIPPFRRVRRRVRRRRLMALATVVVILIAAVSAVAATREVSHRVLVANPASTSTTTKPFPPTTSHGGSAPHDYPNDLVGNAPPIAVDHVGKYTWTSEVVLPFAPDAFNVSYHRGGTGTSDISLPTGRLVTVPGGFSLRVTFTVRSFTGSPTLQITSYASGPIPSVAPHGSVFIPNVVGMTQVQATDVLNRVHLGVIVAVASDAQPQIVVAQSPVPGTALRINGAVTITLGSRATTGP